MRAALRALLATALVCSAASGADAQIYLGGDAPRRGSFEVGGGGMFVRGFEMGGRTADLTRSTPTGRFNLFTTDSEVGDFSGAHVRLGYFLTDTIAVEAGARYARPKLSVRLAGDAESAADVTATETATHYVVDGSVLFHLADLSFAAGRGVPFVSGGGGYLRELHEGNQLVETGRQYHATAGVKYWFGRGDRRLGLRIEGGLSAREKGFDNEDGRRILPLVLAGVSYLF